VGPVEGPACSKENFRPRVPPWGSAWSSREAPIHILPETTAWFTFSPRARAVPKAAAVGYEEVTLPGELVRAQNAVVLLPDPRHVAHGCHLSAHGQIVRARSPPQVILHMQAVGMKSLQATE
jgi:hypothetical protein